LSFESANVENTDTGVRHTVIKARNNKIEQGENNALFYVCVRSYLGGKKYIFNHFNFRIIYTSGKPKQRYEFIFNASRLQLLLSIN